MNRCYLLDDEENEIWFIPFDGESFKVCNVEEINIIDNQFIYGNQCYPLDERFETEREIIETWNKLYPNGRPIQVVEVKKIVTEDEMYKDMVDQLFASYLASF